MNIYDVFTNDYFTANNLGGKEVTTTIKAFRLEALNGKIQNAVLELEGQERPLLLNRNLAHTIASLHGAETDQWVGKAITLYPEAKRWGNDIIHTIRIKTLENDKQVAKAKKQAARAAATREGGCA